MLKLPNVTLVAVTGLTYKIKGHAAALLASSRDIEFGAIEHVQLASIKDIDSWNRAVIYDLAQYVTTEHVLLIHADGYVINPYLWRDEWLALDYIGSPWPLPQDNYSYRDFYGNIQRVGNSVSLRSKRLMELASKLNLEWKSYYGNTNEDGFIAVHNRHIYEKNGMKFGTFEQALIFGKEAPLLENKDLKTFSFHKYG